LARRTPTHPCLGHSCHRCCLGTEMTLTASDAERLRALGHEGFYRRTGDGYLQLVNVHGRCFFLRGGLCGVYDDRPEGCRLYPLILEMDSWDVVLHDFCPHRREFRFREEDRANLMALVERQEREKRLRRRRRARGEPDDI